MDEDLQDKLERLEREQAETLRWYRLTLALLRLLAVLGCYWNGIVVGAALILHDWWLVLSQSIPFVGCVFAYWWLARELKRMDEGSLG